MRSTHARAALQTNQAGAGRGPQPGRHHPATDRLFATSQGKMTRNADKAELFYNYWQMLVGSRMPVAEYRFAAALGRKHRFDFAWVSERVAVEVDGGQWTPHGGRHATDADREKLNIAASLGWRVLRFSPGQLKRNPSGCIELVIKALEA
jgi:very-short-patch-repair endonuclease